MKDVQAMTKNMQRFLAAVDDLMNRPHGTEGMGILWGPPGEGKTISVAYAANMLDGVYLRAMRTWSVTSMLGQLCTELGGRRMLRKADMVQYAIEQLAKTHRPVFIDEADYLFLGDQRIATDMLDTMRDVYDMSRSPIILIGMEDIARRIQSSGRFARRITQWVQYSGVDLDDARNVASTCCEVGVEDDLLRHLHTKAAGNIGRIIVGLSRIEKAAKSGGLSRITLDQWNDRELFYDEPEFNKKRISGSSR